MKDTAYVIGTLQRRTSSEEALMKVALWFATSLLVGCSSTPPAEYRCDHEKILSFVRECISNQRAASHSEGVAVDCGITAQGLFCEWVHPGLPVERQWVFKDGAWHL